MPEELIIDPTLDTEDNFIPDTGIEPDLGLFEIAEETSAPTAEELTAKLEAQAAELERLKQSSDLSAGMSQGFQTLAQQLQAQNAPDYSNLPNLPTPVNAVPQQYNLPDKESFEREFLVNPYDAFSKFLAPVVGNQQQTMNTQMAEMNKMISKNNAFMSDTNKDILSKYNDEVEVYASRLGGKDPYGEAIKQVRSNHFSDIMSDREKSIEQKMYEKAKADIAAEQAVLNKGKGFPVGATQLGAATNPQATKVRVTKAEMDKVKKMTALKFGPDSGAETELLMYNYLKERNEL